jgi:hypothetical protein
VAISPGALFPPMGEDVMSNLLWNYWPVFAYFLFAFIVYTVFLFVYVDDSYGLPRLCGHETLLTAFFLALLWPIAFPVWICAEFPGKYVKILHYIKYKTVPAYRKWKKDRELKLKKVTI